MTEPTQPLWSDDDIKRWAKSNELAWDSRLEIAYWAMKVMRLDYEAALARLTAQVEAQEKRIAELEQQLAQAQWEPIAHSLEYDLITHAIYHGEIPPDYSICRRKEANHAE